MSSKLVIVLCALLALIFGFLDITYHGHFNDARYMKEVQELLLSSRYNTADNKPVTVKVEGRWVTLDGLVPTLEDRTRIAELVKKQVPGIRGITNNLMAYVCDEKVIKAIDALIKSIPVEAEITYRIDPDCIVTLTGWVPTEEMKKGIEDAIRAVPGVKDVRNELEIGSPESKKKEVEQMILDILRVQNIYFDFNKDTIRPESLPSLDKIAAVLKDHPTFKVSIEGHTDSIDTRDYNQKLSMRRSEAVRRALAERGVAAERMQAIGFGEDKPVAPNNTPEGRAENRRTEFKIL